MDDLDLAILQLLRENGRYSIKEISTKLGRRRATIHARIQKMHENGTIKGYTVIPDFQKLGIGVTAFLLVSMLPQAFDSEKSVESLSRKFAEIPQVVEVFNITGEFDYLLKVRADSLETIGSEIIFRLRKEFRVGRTLTLSVFHTETEELSNSFFRLG